MLQMDKEEFLKTECGEQLVECIKVLDFCLERRGIRSLVDTYIYCSAQWKVWQIVFKQFYGVEYDFIRTDEYFGVVTEDKTDWLFKIERDAPHS